MAPSLICCCPFAQVVNSCGGGDYDGSLSFGPNDTALMPSLVAGKAVVEVDMLVCACAGLAPLGV